MTSADPDREPETVTTKLPRQGRQNSTRVYLVTLLWLACALRVTGLGRQSLWHDEAFSWLVITARDLGTVVELALSNFVHPPLYYLLTRPIILVGDSEFLLRLPTAFAGVLAIPVIYWIGREVGDRRVALVVATLLALNPFHVWFSREVRSYALTVLFSLLAILFFLRVLRGKKAWLALTLFSALAFLTHYFCLLIPLSQFVFFVSTLKRQHLIFRRWVLSMAIAALPSMVWFIALFSQQQQMIGIGWIPTPAPWAPLVTLWNFGLLFVGEWTLLAGLTLPFFALAFLLGIRQARPALWLVLWLFVPMLTILFVSWGTGRNLYVDRYFVISLPAYLLLLSIGTQRPARRPLRVVLVVALAASSLLATMQAYVDVRLEKEDWRGAMQLVASNIFPGDIIVFNSVQDIFPAMYYLPDPVAWTSLDRFDVADPWLALIDEHETSRIWLVYVKRQGSNHLLTAGTPFKMLDAVDPITRVWLVSHSDRIVTERSLSGISVMLIEP